MHSNVAQITRIAVASERRPKVNAVRAVVKRIAELQPDPWSNVEIVACSIDSGVRDTPLSDSEMRQGARQRALALRDALLRDGPATGFDRATGSAAATTLYIGLEGGLHVEEDAGATHVWLRGWAYASDARVEGWGCGPSIQLPDVMARAALAGEDLAAIVDRVSGQTDVRSGGGTWGLVTRGLLTRTASFEAATFAALSRFYNSDAYASAPNPEDLPVHPQST